MSLRGCGHEQAVSVESAGNERERGGGGEGGHQSSKEKWLKGKADAGAKMQTYHSCSQAIVKPPGRVWRARCKKWNPHIPASCSLRQYSAFILHLRLQSMSFLQMSCVKQYVSMFLRRAKDFLCKIKY